MIIWCAKTTSFSIYRGSTQTGTALSSAGRPSIDPAPMIQMPIIGYVFGLRSERSSVSRGAGELR